MSDTDPKYFDDEDDQVPDTYRDGSEGMYLGDGVYVSNDFFKPDPEEMIERKKQREARRQQKELEQQKEELVRQERVKEENKTIEEILKEGIVDTNKNNFSWPKRRVTVHRALCHEQFGPKCGHSYVLEVHESLDYQSPFDIERKQITNVYLRRSPVREDREKRSGAGAILADGEEIRSLPYSMSLYEETLVRISFEHQTLSIRNNEDQKISKLYSYVFVSNLVETLNILNEARRVDLISDSPDSIEEAVDCTVKNFKTTDSIIFLLEACARHTGWWDSDSALRRFQKRLREALG